MFQKAANNGSVLHESFEYVAFSEQNQRENNEDSFLVSALLPPIGQSRLIVLAVADGMGGYVHGEDISREALRKLGLYLCEQLVITPSINRPSDGPTATVETLRHVLLDAVKYANTYIRNMVERNNWIKAGSTIVAAVILRNHLVVVNVGDSPLYHFNSQGGRLTKITQDHTVAGSLLRAGMITPEMAEVHEGSNQLEYYLGGDCLPGEEAVHQVELASDDLLLLCSDGISSSLSVGQIRTILAAPVADLESQAESLINDSVRAGATDNQTLILYRHKSAE